MGIVLLIAALIIIVLKITMFKNESEINDKRFMIVSAVVLIIIFGIRNGATNYGTDLNSYYRMYERAIQTTDFWNFYASSSVEIGYSFINWVLARLIKFPQFILFFQATICIGLTFRFIKRYSSDLLFSVLGFMAFGICQFYATGFRQAIAISLCLLAIDYAESRKLIKFLLIVILATTIHKTAILFVLAYMLIRIPLKRITIVGVAVTMIVFSNMLPYFITLGNEVFDKSYSGASWGNSFGGAINILIALFVVLPIFILNKNSEIDDDYGEINDRPAINYEFVLMLVAGIGLYAMRYRALVVERVSMFFTPVLFILVPQAIDTCFVSENRKFLRIVFYCGMLFLIYWRFSVEAYTPFWAS